MGVKFTRILSALTES